MTSKSSAQSQSTRTGGLRDYEEIVRLGEQIVEMLAPGGERSPAEPDLLSRWIAHEIAAAMRDVDKARSAAARQRAVRHATEMILSLWEHRSIWPGGWPPEPARSRVEELNYRKPEGRTEQTGSVWIDRFLELHSLWLDEGRLWWQLGLLEQGVEDERTALEALPKADDEGFDLDLMQRNIELHDAAASWLENNDADSKAETRKLLEKTFRRIASERRTLQKAALAAMKSPRSYAGRIRRRRGKA